MNKELNKNTMLELRDEYIKLYEPNMNYIMKNGSPEDFFESRDVNTFKDMILYLSECIDEKHNKDKNELLDHLKDFPVGKPFDINALYEIHKIYSLITIINNFKGDFDSGFTYLLEQKGFYYDNIPKKLYNNIMKYIDTRCCVVSAENGYILIIRYKCLSNNRHVFTLYIDERIAYSLDKHDYCTLGIEGKLKGLEELLFHAGGCAEIIWQY